MTFTEFAQFKNVQIREAFEFMTRETLQDRKMCNELALPTCFRQS